MKIAYYSYDHVSNPHCGGGGAYRDSMIHRELSSRHEIHCYYGAFKGCVATSTNGVRISFLGIPFTYLIGRMSFAVLASLHSLFVRADIIVICFSVFAPVLGFIFRNRKSVVELFHLTGKEPIRKYSLFGIVPVIFEKLAVVSGKNFVCINTDVAKRLLDRSGQKNVATIYTGFDRNLLSLIPGDDRYILFLGRIDIHMKGIDILCDAFDRVSPEFPEYRLIFAGRGSSRDTDWLRKRMLGSTLADRILFQENVSNQEKMRLLQNATFACMPSRFEGWCISAIEAAACSKATIGTRIPGLRESIIEGETGLLVPPENTEALCEALSRMLRDKSLRDQLGRNGNIRARQFTWDSLAQQQEIFYQSVSNRLKTKGR